MPINTKDQLTILNDILQNQLDDCCGTVSECQQIQRLIQSILAKTDSMQLSTALQDIYQYSQTAVNSPDLDGYVSNNQHQLSSWIDTVTPHLSTFSDEI
jgi:hypothetical protein